jgi:hypothetical protein
MTFDANAWAVEKSVNCQHPKVVCLPCAMALAQGSYVEGQGVQLERVRAIITALGAERNTPSTRFIIDAVLQALR